MRVKTAVLVGGIGLLAASLPLVAHHSFAAEFDSAKSVSLTGTVTKIDWMNPHIWLYLDAKDESGTVAHWQCEGGPPNVLTRNGWSKDSLKVGDHVTSKVPGFNWKGVIIEDLGPLGVGGRQIFLVHVGDEDEGRRFDVPAENLERAAA